MLNSQLAISLSFILVIWADRNCHSDQVQKKLSFPRGNPEKVMPTITAILFPGAKFYD
jgi:hypothetical protein